MIKRNTWITIVSIGGMVFIGMLTIVMRQMKMPEKHKKVVYPEEWRGIKQGDTLRAYRVTPDSIYLGFYNKANR